MKSNREMIIKILEENSFKVNDESSVLRVVEDVQFGDVADQILSALKPKEEIAPPLQQAAVMGWVADFEKQPPEYMQVCLITDQWGQVNEAQYTGEANLFTGVDTNYEAKAWMPKPPPFA